MPKRRRTGYTSRARPKDKSLINISHTVTNSQASTTLFTASHACTITGLRWSLGMAKSAGGHNYNWAIVIVREGTSVSTMDTSDGQPAYEPEQNVLAFGAGRSEANEIQHWDSNTKTMRKMQSGDKLRFISLSSGASTGVLHGIIQFFCME